ncbi:MAG: SWIM zinc finger domain-containing protein, partial [Chloroflexales bacterium]|nr:SWIM zinc finger domain-containing protein [Chloroflexales bacterium]
AFRSEPSLARYQTLRDLTGAGWEKLRAGLLAFLRDEQTAWRWRSAAVDIFLHEGLIDDAIRAVGSSGYGDLARVMDAAIALRPDWVITAATQQAARIVDAGKAQRYDDAIEWLRRARASYRASGRTEGWKAYLDDLRARHGRKYKLMGLIEQLEAGA